MQFAASPVSVPLCTCTCLQAEVFEEIATMDFPFEGIPTVPPRKDMDHMVRPPSRTCMM